MQTGFDGNKWLRRTLGTAFSAVMCTVVLFVSIVVPSRYETNSALADSRCTSSDVAAWRTESGDCHL
jgi:hypothetical protein